MLYVKTINIGDYKNIDVVYKYWPPTYSYWDGESDEDFDFISVSENIDDDYFELHFNEIADQCRIYDEGDAVLVDIELDI